MQKNIEGLEEKLTFESQLAVFIDFVEDEAERIDEEKRGLRRKDGGRKVCCSGFLKQFIPVLLSSQGKEEYREVVMDANEIKIEVRKEALKKIRSALTS